ncbi:mechanosensitive ion channel family protein [Glaciecola siphonariae]|uniref:Mechanosensitive ion channel family protein n=1 Tax=Glaciecola siphonariae TaxID=521012 RepID=A0ABV9LT78_9ALTE
MNLEALYAHIVAASEKVLTALSDPHTYIQLVVVLVIYLLAFALAKKLRASNRLTFQPPDDTSHPVVRLIYRAGALLFPLLVLIFLLISTEFADQLSKELAYSPWLIKTAFAVAALMFFNALINVSVTNPVAASAFKWVGLPLVFLKLVGLLPLLISSLQEISIEVGNIEVSAYGIARVIIFGGFLFWLGRASNNFGQSVIKRQESLDIPTREVFAKLFEVTLFCVIALLLLNVMGINLTTLAVFGGALGVGIGLGLQTIASNFISGIIILLDKSLTVGDFVELEDGQKGFVREFRMRYAVLETYDGKDILVPNEKFISTFLVNWTHKDPKQRYRVDFSVAYATDIRAMVELVKEAVATHPQVISGEDIPFEERPDCEIDSFGDSGVNMFVEFWMEGIDDGKNRVGGDLLLIIFETLKAHNISIPFPQREVRVLNDADAFTANIKMSKVNPAD